WKQKGGELPSLTTNATDKLENIPGRLPPHTVAVHPTPTQFVAVAWKSPIDGPVKTSARIAHAHPACGNGVAFWVEHRHADTAFALAEGPVDLGKEAHVLPKTVTIAKGDFVMLAIDARDANHVCDLTEIALTI